MHGPSLSDHWYPARRASATADPDDSPVNGPFLVDDSLLLFGQPNAQPSHGAPACVPTQKTLSILANKVMGSPQFPGKSECLIHSRSRNNRRGGTGPAAGRAVFSMPDRFAPGARPVRVTDSHRS